MPPDENQLPISQAVESVRHKHTDAPDGHICHLIAHVLFLDIVGFTKLPPVKQRLVLEKLQAIVQTADEFCTAKKKGELIASPTGDGMALVFLNIVDGSGPATSCAEKIAEAVKAYNNSTTDDEGKIKVRMGIHSGSVVIVDDINDNLNVAGEGINTAQRVMDCGESDHILLSYDAYHLLPGDYPTNQCLPFDIDVKVKHNQTIRLHNLYNDKIGNQEVPTKILSQKEESLRELREQERYKRFMDDIKEEAKRLKWKRQLWAAILVILAISASTIMVWAYVRKPSPPPSLMIIPFTAVSQNKYSSRAISKGLTEQFNRNFNDLAIKGLLSIVKNPLSQNSVVQTAPQKPLSALETGKQLKVRYVLTGTAESHKEDTSLDDTDFPVDVHVELYDTEANELRWKHDYNSSSAFNDLISLQKTIVQGVVDNLKVTNEETNKQYTRDSRAFWYYMLGRYWAMQRPSYENDKDKAKEVTNNAIEYYNKAINLDRGYALAYVGLADVYISIGGLSMIPIDARNEALKNITEALDRDDKLPEAYSSLGLEKCWIERDFLSARLAFLKAFELNPQSADSYKRYSTCLTAFGKSDEAGDQLNKALEIEQESLFFHVAAGQNYFFAGKKDQAIEQLEPVVEKKPDLLVAHRFLALAYEQKGNDEKALKHLKAAEGKSKEGESKETEDSDILGARGHILARTNRDEALKIAKRLESLRGEKGIYISPYNIALIYAEIPDRWNTAFEWLDRAISEFDPRVSWLQVDPRFDRLRKSKGQEFNRRLQDARFQL